MTITPEQFSALKPNDFIYKIEERRYVKGICCIGDIHIRSMPDRIEKVFFCSSDNKLIRLNPDQLNGCFINEKEALEKALKFTEIDLLDEKQSTQEWIDYLKSRLNKLGVNHAN